jgi:hypothetical protein
MKEAPGSSETSVLTRATRRNNQEDTILHRQILLFKENCVTSYTLSSASEEHGTKSQKISVIDTAVKTSQKTVFFDPTHFHSFLGFLLKTHCTVFE